MNEMEHKNDRVYRPVEFFHTIDRCGADKTCWYTDKVVVSLHNRHKYEVSPARMCRVDPPRTSMKNISTLISSHSMNQCRSSAKNAHRQHSTHQISDVRGWCTVLRRANDVHKKSTGIAKDYTSGTPAEGRRRGNPALHLCRKDISNVVRSVRNTQHSLLFSFPTTCSGPNDAHQLLCSQCKHTNERILKDRLCRTRPQTMMRQHFARNEHRDDYDGISYNNPRSEHRFAPACDTESYTFYNHCNGNRRP